MNPENKIKIVLAISEFHPGGWSHYVGGMADTGNWDLRKLLLAPDQELELCLKELIEIQNTPPTELTEQEKKDSKIIIVIDGGRIITNKHEMNLMEKIIEKQTMALLWGK
jgi:hypothetical protein